MLAYEFYPLAEKELDEAVAYYKALELGKGRELLQRIQAAIEQLANSRICSHQSWLGTFARYPAVAAVELHASLPRHFQRYSYSHGGT